MTEPDAFDLLFAELVPAFLPLTPEQAEEAKALARLLASRMRAEADLTGRPAEEIALQTLVDQLAARLRER